MCARAADDRVKVRESFKGRRRSRELLVDGVPVRHGRFQDGTYFLYENAYVWSEDLRELGRQLITDRAQRRVPTVDPRPEND